MQCAGKTREHLWRYARGNCAYPLHKRTNATHGHYTSLCTEFTMQTAEFIVNPRENCQHFFLQEHRQVHPTPLAAGCNSRTNKFERFVCLVRMCFRAEMYDEPSQHVMQSTAQQIGNCHPP